MPSRFLTSPSLAPPFAVLPVSPRFDGVALLPPRGGASAGSMSRNPFREASLLV